MVVLSFSVWLQNGTAASQAHAHTPHRLADGHVQRRTLMALVGSHRRRRLGATFAVIETAFGGGAAAERVQMEEIQRRRPLIEQ